MPGFEIEGIGGGGSMEAITTTIDCQFLPVVIIKPIYWSALM